MADLPVKFPLNYVVDRNDKSEHTTHLDNVVRIIITWSEMGDSNSRPDGPKPPALPTALIPDFWVFSFALTVVKHVVTAIF